MIVLADENVDRAITARLRKDGHTVTSIAEVSPSVSDETVLEMACSLKAVLLTSDRDFGEMIFRQGQATHGVVLMRLAGVQTDVKALIISQAFRDHGNEMESHFTTISENLIRIRRINHE